MRENYANRATLIPEKLQLVNSVTNRNNTTYFQVVVIDIIRSFRFEEGCIDVTARRLYVLRHWQSFAQIIRQETPSCGFNIK